MPCKCKPCPECGGSGDVYYSFPGVNGGEYLGRHRLDDLDDCDIGGCPECEGTGIIEMCDECMFEQEEFDDEIWTDALSEEEGSSES